MQIHRVLYPVDFTSAAHHGLQAAIAMARSYGAELLLCHVIDFPYPYLNQVALSFDIDRYYREMEDAASERLEALAATIGNTPAMNKLVLRGDPATSIVELISEEGIDLVVMPTHARKGFERVLVGSVTEKVMRTSPCPVLTITPHDEPTGPFTIDKILFPTDFSDRSDSALGTALAIAEKFDASVLMLHVVTIGDADPANPDWAFPAIPEEHIASAIQVAEKALTQRGKDAGDGVPVSTRLVRGFDPAFEICRVANEEQVDLILMATHGHGGLMRVLLGSTAAKVVRHYDGPVMTVRDTD